jgi:hypothetical protein
VTPGRVGKWLFTTVRKGKGPNLSRPRSRPL